MCNHDLSFHCSCTSIIDPTQECERQAGLKRVLPPIVTTKFRSKKTFSFKYGKVEIRAKVPKGDWLFPRKYHHTFFPKKSVSISLFNQILMKSFINLQRST